MRKVIQNLNSQRKIGFHPFRFLWESLGLACQAEESLSRIC